MEREVVERLVVICEPVDSVWEGRMGVVLSLPPRVTIRLIPYWYVLISPYNEGTYMSMY